MNASQNKNVDEEYKPFVGWEGLLNALDASRKIPQFGDPEKRDDAGEYPVLLSREPIPGRTTSAKWNKSNRQNARFDLRDLNQHELDILKTLGASGPWSRFLAVAETSTVLERLSGGEEPKEIKLQTEDVGPSARLWLDWKVRPSENDKGVPNVFSHAGNYLRFMLGALNAINAVHEKGVTHCDLNAGNFCIRSPWCPPTSGSSGERIRVEPDWNNVAVIDFGCALNLQKPPIKLPPLNDSPSERGMSNQLRAAFKNARQDGELNFNKDSKARTAWSKFQCDCEHKEDEPCSCVINATGFACNSKEFWSGDVKQALKAFQRVDWREDYWRLGNLFAEVRDGKRLHRTYPQKGWTYERCVQRTKVHVIDELVGASESRQDEGEIVEIIPAHEEDEIVEIIPAYGLAIELTKWGDHVADYDGETDWEKFMQASRELRERTYKDIRVRLENAIALLEPAHDVNELYIYREGFGADATSSDTTNGELGLKVATIVVPSSAPNPVVSVIPSATLAPRGVGASTGLLGWLPEPPLMWKINDDEHAELGQNK